MNLVKFYRYSLFLPIIVPLLVSPMLLFLPSTSETIAIVILSIVYSIIVGGIPYLILAAPLFFWMNQKSEKQIRRKILQIPIGMILIYCIFAGCAFLFSLFLTNKPVSETLEGGLITLFFLSLFTLIFGYFYIGLTFGVGWLFKKMVG